MLSKITETTDKLMASVKRQGNEAARAATTAPATDDSVEVIDAEDNVGRSRREFRRH